MLCRFSGLPPEDSDTLLWSHSPGRGLFGVSDYATQIRLEAQEHGFVLATLAYAPLEVRARLTHVRVGLPVRLRPATLLLSVVAGRLSFVGPRALPPGTGARYIGPRRLMAPGLIGPAQR